MKRTFPINGVSIALEQFRQPFRLMLIGKGMTYVVPAQYSRGEHPGESEIFHQLLHFSQRAVKISPPGMFREWKILNKSRHKYPSARAASPRAEIPCCRTSKSLTFRQV